MNIDYIHWGWDMSNAVMLCNYGLQYWIWKCRLFSSVNHALEVSIWLSDSYHTTLCDIDCTQINSQQKCRVVTHLTRSMKDFTWHIVTILYALSSLQSNEGKHLHMLITVVPCANMWPDRITMFHVGAVLNACFYKTWNKLVSPLWSGSKATAVCVSCDGLWEGITAMEFSRKKPLHSMWYVKTTLQSLKYLSHVYVY